MHERRKGLTPKRTALLLCALLIAAAVLWLLYAIYIDGAMTWGDVYEALGLQGGVAQNASPATSPADGAVRVTFVDVGQGDCIVIEAGESVVMIDAGDFAAETTVLSFLAAHGIKKIDYLVATHPHTDHIGSMQAVVEGCEIGQILFANVPADMTPTNSTYRYLLEAIQKKGAPVSVPVAGDEIALDKGVLRVLYAGAGSDLNNCSLVLQYVYGDTRFLLTGDAEFEVEDALCDQYGDALRSDVLKAGHHGTKYATGNGILAEARPSYLVIMCGLDNEYGYPKQAVLDRAAKAGAEILRTDLQGDITFTSDGRTLTPSVEKEAA
ncbi:MAG: MBL fold metallo-hydrolase [Oscillospiraceae bacterium]|nr:MBL fold metallo-hydrolase [Oscillospiraceae bacterium]